MAPDIPETGKTERVIETTITTSPAAPRVTIQFGDEATADRTITVGGGAGTVVAQAGDLVPGRTYDVLFGDNGPTVLPPQSRAERRRAIARLPRRYRKGLKVRP
jgi:hypothetical protein